MTSSMKAAVALSLCVPSSWGALLVSPADVDALTAALDRVMGDPALRGSVCHSSGRGTGTFSMERIAGMWEELFAELR